MGKRNLLLGLLFTVLAFSVNAQDATYKFGLKGGINYAKYTPDITVVGVNVAEFNRKFGFYFGGFTNIKLSKKIKIQPEILFALQGSEILQEGFELRNSQNEAPVIGNFRANVNESTIIVPITLQYFFTDDFYVEMGPQIGYIIDRKQTIKENIFDQFEGFNDVSPLPSEYDKFDVGMNVGTGYKISNNFGINGRFFFGLIERDDLIKTSVFNLGIEYTL